MRRWTVPLVLLLLVAGLEAPASSSGFSVSMIRVSGPSPFPVGACGQIDTVFYGSGHGKELDPSIAVNPTDPANIVAAWIQDEALGIVVAATFDGGETWTRTVVPGLTVCSGGSSQRILHARLSFGGDGRLYLTGEALDGYFPDPRSGINPIPTSTSTDGGLTWTTPVLVNEVPAMNGLDTIAGEPDVPGAAVVAWHWPEPAAASYVSRTVDGGRTWTRYDLPGYALDALPIQRILAAPDGTLYVIFSGSTLRSLLGAVGQDVTGLPLGEPEAMYAIRSDDKAQTWTAPVMVSPDTIGEWAGGGVAADGAVTVAGWRRGPDGERILFVSRSVDRGASWSAPVDVEVVQPPFPVLAVRADGTLGVHVSVASSAAGMHQAVFLVSKNGGATWDRKEVGSPFTPAGAFYQETVATPSGFASIVVRGDAGADGPTDVYATFVALTG